MTVTRPAYPPLLVDGLSYSDWEDDAGHLRQLAVGAGRVNKRHLLRVEKLIAGVDDELDAIASVSPGLVGFDVIRVGCIRELLLAFRISVTETQALLQARTAKTAKSQKAVA